MAELGGCLQLDRGDKQETMQTLADSLADDAWRKKHFALWLRQSVTLLERFGSGAGDQLDGARSGER